MGSVIQLARIGFHQYDIYPWERPRPRCGNGAPPPPHRFAWLAQRFTVNQLKDGGFSDTDLKNAGFNARQMKDAGFSAKQLKDAGFDASELKQVDQVPRRMYED